MNAYIFDDAAFAAELERLRALEAVFDPATRRRLTAAGLRAGLRCLEAGPGAGSIARWMGEAGADVTAVDVNPRFLRGRDLPRVTVVEGDIRTVALEKGAQDLAHARYLLVHLPDAPGALSAMAGALRPGGKIVLEEPDFTAARAVQGAEEDVAAVERVNRAMLAMFRKSGKDPALGARLEAMAAGAGLSMEASETDGPTSAGGDGLARMMAMSARHLAAPYAATGLCTAEDVERYARFAEDPATRAVYYATVAVTAVKGA